MLKLGRVTIDKTLDEQGNNKHIDRMVALRHWASPLKLDEGRLTVHVLEAIDPAAAILEFAAVNHVDHIVIGARRRIRWCARCSAASPPGWRRRRLARVTVVRPPRLAALQELEGTSKEPDEDSDELRGRA